MILPLMVAWGEASWGSSGVGELRTYSKFSVMFWPNLEIQKNHTIFRIKK